MMLKKDIPTGIILYEGPSELDGQPIVVIANTFKRNTNKKTGQVIQTWIMRSDIHPSNALKRGEDSSICGNCKHRGVWSEEKKQMINNTCYVRVVHSPAGIWRTYKTGLSYVRYESDMDKFFKNQKMRLGCYGDPAAVPLEIWTHFCNIVDGFTGYTHQWKICNPLLAYYCMASVDTVWEQKEAKDIGWRTFRIREIDDPIILSNEIVCPASKEAGRVTNCHDCSVCMGLSSRVSKDVVIKVHGLKHDIRQFSKMIQNFKFIPAGEKSVNSTTDVNREVKDYVSV